MISRLRGILLDRDQHTVEIATAGGVVYEVEVPLTVATRLPAPGTDVELRTLHVVREEQIALFGFLEAGERALFLRLIGVSGVGAKLALALLSAYPARRLARALAERDVASLVQVSGVGKKTAERLVLELSDRMDGLELDMDGSDGSVQGAHAAIQALVALGMPFQDADRAVRDVLDEVGPGRTEEIVRRVLGRR